MMRVNQKSVRAQSMTAVVGAAVAVASLSQAAWGQQYFDTNGSGTNFGATTGIWGNWDLTSNNWSPSSAGTSAATTNYQSGTKAVFNTTGATGPLTVNIKQDTTVNGLDLLGTQNLTLGETDPANPQRTVTMSGVVTVASGRTLAINNQVSLRGNWTKSGPGIMVLGTTVSNPNSNVFQGTVTITAGQLNFQTHLRNSPVNPLNIHIATNATDSAGLFMNCSFGNDQKLFLGNVSADPTSPSGNGFTFTSNANNTTIVFDISSNVMYNRSLGGNAGSGMASFVKRGAGTWTLGVGQLGQFDGTFTIETGMVIAQAQAAFGTGNVTIINQGTFINEGATVQMETWRNDPQSKLNLVGPNSTYIVGRSGVQPLTHSNSFHGNGTVTATFSAVNGGRFLFDFNAPNTNAANGSAPIDRMNLPILNSGGAWTFEFNDLGVAGTGMPIDTAVTIIGTQLDISTGAWTGTPSSITASITNAGASKYLLDPFYGTNSFTWDTTNKVVATAFTLKSLWLTDGDASFTDGTNWAGGTPGTAGSVANFTAAATAPQTVSLNTNAAVGTLRFNNTASAYTLAGTGSLAIDTGGAGAGAISVVAGEHAVSVPVTLAQNTTAALTGSAELTVTSISSAPSVTLAVSGTGTLATPKLRVGSLSLDSVSGAYTGLVDLGRGKAILSNTSESAVRLLVDGWLDTGKGLGSTATGDPRDPYATLGVISNATPFGFAEFSSFDGVAVGASDVLVMYTYEGDTDLNGVVDARDVNALLNGWSNGLTGWRNGDVNYDGVVNGTDYTALLAALANQGAPFAGGTGGAGAIPEPAALGLLTLAVPMLSRRRR